MSAITRCPLRRMSAIDRPDCTLNGIFSSGFIFASHFFNISRGFNFTNWLPVDFTPEFIFVNLSFINVLYILIFSWFFLQLVGCESRNSYSNFSILQIPLFGYKRINSREKTSFICCLYLHCLMFSKIFLT